MSKRHLLTILLAVAFALPLVGCGAAGALALYDVVKDELDNGDDNDGPGTTMSGVELALAAAVHSLIQDERTAAQTGLSLLIWSDATAEVAHQHAIDMDVRGFYDSVNPDGKNPSTRLTEAGLTVSAVAENLALGTLTAEQIVAGWMADPQARANLLNSNFTRIGVGVHQQGGQTWWVADLRRP